MVEVGGGSAGSKQKRKADRRAKLREGGRKKKGGRREQKGKEEMRERKEGKGKKEGEGRKVRVEKGAGGEGKWMEVGRTEYDGRRRGK